MAANIDVTPGSGKTVKTTEVGGVQIQHVVIDSDAGTSVDLNALLVAQQATLDSIDDTLATPATSIPHFAADATSDLTRAYDDGSTAAEESLVGATSGQTTRVYRVKVTAAGAAYVTLLNGSGGSELRRWTFPAAGAYDEPFDPRPYAVTSANTALYWARSAAVACTIEIDYIKSA